LAPILDTALDAVVVIRADGRILAWNGAAERTFGWTSGEAMGRDMGSLIVPAQHREAHRLGMKRYTASGEARVLGQRIEISAVTRTGEEIPIELSINKMEAEGEVLFIGFLRNIGERKRAEEDLQRRARQAELLFEITRLAADTESFDDALYSCLRAICSIAAWPVGHAFLVGSGGGRELVPTSLWYEAAPGISHALQEATRGVRFSEGVGLPGIVLATGEPTWISDAEQDPEFRRKGAGFGAAFGFPIKSEGKIIAILEFFAASTSPPDKDLMLTVRTLGEQLGRVMERKRTEEHQRLLVHELNHRVKNTLAVVQSLAAQSFRGDAADPSAKRSFESRLAALAGAHDLLTLANWEAASLQEIAEISGRGCGADPARVSMSGPDLRLQPRAAVSISMALHELCTNAVKYGALSNDAGSVRITWDVTSKEGSPAFTLLWEESGGPAVSPPSRQGFGTRMIERALASELGGSARLEYPASGLRCTIEAPLPSEAEAPPTA
jgi:PAS domain S-box-containing protein